jgi:hypothetical protein
MIMDSLNTTAGIVPHYSYSTNKEMKIDILEVIEKDDGSAEVAIDIDRKGMDILIREGFTSIINKGLKQCIK